MNKNNNISFEFNVGKSGWVWGIVLVLTAVLIVLEGLGMGFSAYGVSLWKVALGVLLLAWLIKELIRLRIAGIFFPAAFIFMLFEKNIASLLGREDPNIISNWYVLLAALLLTVGFGAIFHTGRKEKYDCFSSVNCNKNSFSGNAVTYIDAAELGTTSIENDFGKTTVYIENKEAYLGNGTIRVDNSFGEIELHVPADWYVAADIDSSFGSVFVRQNQNPENPRINIVGDNDFGSIKIVNS